MRDCRDSILHCSCLSICTQLDFKRNLHGGLGANRFHFLQQCDLF
jgi:hypothetical protein